MCNCVGFSQIQACMIVIFIKLLNCHIYQATEFACYCEDWFQFVSFTILKFDVQYTEICLKTFSVNKWLSQAGHFVT